MNQIAGGCRRYSMCVDGVVPVVVAANLAARLCVGSVVVVVMFAIVVIVV